MIKCDLKFKDYNLNIMIDSTVSLKTDIIQYV